MISNDSSATSKTTRSRPGCALLPKSGRSVAREPEPICSAGPACMISRRDGPHAWHAPRRSWPELQPRRLRYKSPGFFSAGLRPAGMITNYVFGGVCLEGGKSGICNLAIRILQPATAVAGGCAAETAIPKGPWLLWSRPLACNSTINQQPELQPRRHAPHRRSGWVGSLCILYLGLSLGGRRRRSFDSLRSLRMT